jgi:hypothetical protein
MLVTLLLLLLCWRAYATTSPSFIIYDPRYETPFCGTTTNGASLPNQYATMQLSSDLLRETVTFTLNLSAIPAYSCYLCDIRTSAGRYCNASLQPPDPTLSVDLSFNLLAVAIGATQQPFPRLTYQYANQFTITVPTSESFPLTDLLPSADSPVPSCDDDLLLIVMPLMELSRPYSMDLVTMLSDGDEAHQVTCNASTQVFGSVDCSLLSGRYTYVTLQTPNCVAMRSQSSTAASTDVTSIVRRSALEWYSVSLLLGDSFDALQQMTLCGTRWLDLLQGTQLTMQCGPYAHYYARVRPWHQLAQQLIATHLNLYAVVVGRTSDEQATLLRAIGMDYVVALDVLERSCDSRNQSLWWTANGQALYTRISQFNGDATLSADERARLCGEISVTLNRTIAAMDAAFLPLYLALWDTWYFRPMQFIVFYTGSVLSMETRSVLYVVFVALAVLCFVIVAFIVPTWICCAYGWRRCHKRMKKKRTASRKTTPIAYQLI